MYVNPMTPFVNGYHNLILDGSLPESTDFFAALVWLLVFYGAAALLHRRVEADLVDWA